MNGVGGSLVTVIPEIDTVICITCSLVYNPKPRMELINNYLLPYIEKLQALKNISGVLEYTNYKTLINNN